jgi:CheY-like chemotaxis protein
MMPNMSGLDLIKRIKSHDVSIPIIVITGYASLEIAIDAMKYGASDFISKPFKVKQIELLMNKVTREKSLLEENRRFSDTLHLHRLIDNLVGQLEDKNEEIISLQAISERIISLKGIRDLVGAIIDVSKQLLDESDVRFFTLSRKDGTLVDTSSAKEIPVNRMLQGIEVRKQDSESSLQDRHETIFPLMNEARCWRPQHPLLLGAGRGQGGEDPVPAEQVRREDGERGPLRGSLRKHALDPEQHGKDPGCQGSPHIPALHEGDHPFHDHGNGSQASGRRARHPLHCRLPPRHRQGGHTGRYPAEGKQAKRRDRCHP